MLENVNVVIRKEFPFSQCRGLDTSYVQHGVVYFWKQSSVSSQKLSKMNSWLIYHGNFYLIFIICIAVAPRSLNERLVLQCAEHPTNKYSKRQVLTTRAHNLYFQTANFFHTGILNLRFFSLKM